MTFLFSGHILQERILNNSAKKKNNKHVLLQYFFFHEAYFFPFLSDLNALQVSKGRVGRVSWANTASLGIFSVQSWGKKHKVQAQQEISCYRAQHLLGASDSCFPADNNLLYVRQESLLEVVKEEGFMTAFQTCKSLPKVTSFEQGKSSHIER